MGSEKKLTIEEVKKLILNILIDFDSFCKANNLSYSLAGGTLLGAVRHKGFIPWDDDIDVYMPRKDYDFLIKNYNKWGQQKGYKVVSNKNRGFYMMIAKIIDKSTFAMENNRCEKIGVWIDILPVEYIDDISFEQRTLLYDYSEQMYYFGKNNLQSIKNPLKRIKYLIARLIKKQLIKKKYEEIINAHIGVSNCCFYSKRRQKAWSNLPSDLGIIDSKTTLSFEGINFKVMEKWEEYLRLYFGDNYLELPPENERVSHECAIRKFK